MVVAGSPIPTVNAPDRVVVAALPWLLSELLDDEQPAMAATRTVSAAAPAVVVLVLIGPPGGDKRQKIHSSERAVVPASGRCPSPGGSAVRTGTLLPELGRPGLGVPGGPSAQTS